MELMYWTFPHITGRWSVKAGQKNVLVSGTGVGEVAMPVKRWDQANNPVVAGMSLDTAWDEYTGILWEAPVVASNSTGHKNAGVEKSGGSVGYYKARITSPTSGADAYTAECNDIIEALGMNYAEGNAFKAIWRSCAARTLGKLKEGGDSVYDAEKVIFFGQRMLAQRKEEANATRS